jgi:ABC-2 type transport system ATP-binding protein
MLSIKDVTYGYTANYKVLSNFSLEFSEGGIYGLLGKNGTGKSTLLYLIMGLLHPNKGEVLYNGVDTRLRNPDIMSDMFIVPEEYNLPAISLKEYINSLRRFYPRFSEDTLKRCLDGFGMPLDVNLGALSMGQKKKVYMCMALAANTGLLLMDEPTNGLDIPSKSQFRKVVANSMTDDRTIIISTHQVRDV